MTIDGGSMTKIIIDTDLAMGDIGSEIDDGFALALAVAEPAIQILLITTVSGNTDASSSSVLTKALAQRLGAVDVPIIQGAASPILERGGYRPTGPRSDHSDAENPPVHAARAIIDCIRSNPHEVTLLSIGPLTNVALAIMLDPGIVDLVKEAVIMGGAFTTQSGRLDMPGEFNVWSDPVAAEVILRCGVPQRWVGYDLTQHVRLDRSQLQILRQRGGQFAPFAADCADEWIRRNEQEEDWDGKAPSSCALHDPLAVTAISMPELFTWRPAHVEVSLTENLWGVTLTDLLFTADPPAKNCEIAVGVDRQRFMNYFINAISSL